jgi:hypothetical protein
VQSRRPRTRDGGVAAAIARQNLDAARERGHADGYWRRSFARAQTNLAVAQTRTRGEHRASAQPCRRTPTSRAAARRPRVRRTSRTSRAGPGGDDGPGEPEPHLGAAA